MTMKETIAEQARWLETAFNKISKLEAQIEKLQATTPQHDIELLAETLENKIRAATEEFLTNLKQKMGWQ